MLAQPTITAQQVRMDRAAGAATVPCMRWMIGADLGVRGHGALEFAGWLCSHSRSEAQQQLDAVHVLDARLGNLLRTDLHEQLMERTRQELSAALEQSKANACITDAHVVEDISPETGILEVLASSESDALIIGRRAKRESHALVRLGSVARRLLRRRSWPTSSRASSSSCTSI